MSSEFDRCVISGSQETLREIVTGGGSRENVLVSRYFSLLLRYALEKIVTDDEKGGAALSAKSAIFDFYETLSEDDNRWLTDYIERGKGHTTRGQIISEAVRERIREIKEAEKLEREGVKT